MNTLTRYVNRLFLIRLCGAVFAIALFALLFDLLDVSEDLADEANVLGALARYAALRLPGLVSEILPIAALLAGLFTASELLRSNELVVMWASGLSFARIMWKLLPAGLLLFVLKIANDDAILPRTVEALRAWGVGSFDAAALGADMGHLWVADGHDIVRLPMLSAEVDADGAVLIFRRDAEGRLVERLTAAAVSFEDDVWHLSDVDRYEVGSGRLVHIDRLDWPSALPLDRLEAVARPPRETDLATLIDIVRHDGYGVTTTEAHRTWLYYRITAALVPMLMVFLAFALAHRFVRGGGASRLFLKGVAIGFSFLIANGLAIALGEAGLLPPALAAFGPTSLLALFALGYPVLIGRRVGAGA
ncbi:MAG: LptF/LptG family permease [Geminicoccaceae bacterium]|nr:LptF/LptG family permease [Geminicoccaceae bacterium]